ncbi:unnamed protein product [Effrenium voratum]|nr:unnamed protein product [Effrenium voratum]
MSGYYQPAFPQLYGQSQGSYPQSQAPQQSYPARSADPRYPQGYAAAAQTQAAPQAAQAPAAQAYAGYQPAQGQAQAQPAAREEVVGNVAHISVTGCTHSTVGGIVRGSFTASGQNHGRPTYKKDTQVNGLDVQLYYWDDRDGASFCGWWFGPKVGGAKVPYDGPVDHSFAISAAQPPAAQAATAPGAAAGATAATAAQYAVYQQQLQQYQQQQQAYQQQQDQQTQMQQQMIAQQQKALQMAEIQKKQEEMKRRQEEMRRQQEEARQRQQEEVKRKAAEHRVKMEEMNRQKMEQEKRMAEERKKQYEEQRATIRIRTCMQKECECPRRRTWRPTSRRVGGAHAGGAAQLRLQRREGARGMRPSS